MKKKKTPLLTQIFLINTHENYDFNSSRYIACGYAFVMCQFPLDDAEKVKY